MTAPAAKKSPLGWILIGIVVLVLLAIAGKSGGGSAATQTTNPGDAHTAAIIRGNLADWTSSSWYPAVTNVDVSGTLVVVGTNLSQSDDVAGFAVCRGIAAITHDPDTAASLGMTKVYVYSVGNQKIADCPVP